MNISMHGLLEHVVKELVDNPALCLITTSEVGGVVTYYVNVAPVDRGKVIGRQGNTIKALRSLVDLLAQQSPTPLVEIVG